MQRSAAPSQPRFSATSPTPPPARCGYGPRSTRRQRRSSASSQRQSTRRWRPSQRRSTAPSRRTAPICATTRPPKLRKLRGEFRTGRQRVRDKLEQLVRSSDLREHLQEDFITLRGGRPVLAVKASAPAAACPGSSTTPPTPARRSSSSRGRGSSSRTAVGGDERRARGGRADPPGLSAGGGEVSSKLTGRSRRPGRSTCGRARDGVARLEARAGRGLGRGCTLGAARHPLLDPGSAVPIDLELGGLRAS